MGHALSRLREGRKQARSGDHDFTKEYSDRRTIKERALSLLSRNRLPSYPLGSNFSNFASVEPYWECELHSDPFERSLVKETRRIPPECFIEFDVSDMERYSGVCKPYVVEESVASSWRSFLPASGKSRSVLLPPESGQSTPSGTLHRPLSDSTESFSEKDFEYDFYIIHSRTDATEWVQRNLLPTLEMDHGLKCCVDRKDFLPGRTFADNIENFILKSRKTIAVLSNGFLKSDVSVHELQLAVSVSGQRNDESVIIIKIDNVEMNLLPEAFNEKNVIDLTTSEKTLEEELFPFLEVRAKQGVKQGTAKVKESSQQVSSISSDLRFPSRPPSPLVSDKLSSSSNIVLAGREKEHEDFDIALDYQTGGTEKL